MARKRLPRFPATLKKTLPDARGRPLSCPDGVSTSQPLLLPGQDRALSGGVSMFLCIRTMDASQIPAYTSLEPGINENLKALFNLLHYFV